MIVLYCSLIFGCLWFGVMQSRRLQTRVAFYENFFSFLKAYERNLSFSKKEFRAVVEEFLKEVNEENFKNFLNSAMIGEEKGVEFLSARELSELKGVVLSLGKTDEFTEEKVVGSALGFAGCKLEQAKKTAQKYSGFSIKVSLLVGVLLVILLL